MLLIKWIIAWFNIRYIGTLISKFASYWLTNLLLPWKCGIICGYRRSWQMEHVHDLQGKCCVSLIIFFPLWRLNLLYCASKVSQLNNLGMKRPLLDYWIHSAKWQWYVIESPLLSVFTESFHGKNILCYFEGIRNQIQIRIWELSVLENTNKPLLFHCQSFQDHYWRCLRIDQPVRLMSITFFKL